MYNFLLKIKSKLPFNGDWIFVTLSPEPKTKYRDIYEEFDTSEKIEKYFVTKNIKIIEIIYKQSVLFYENIHSHSNRLLDKAKIIIGASSFMAAVTFAVSGYLINFNISKESIFLFGLFFLLFLMISIHFTRSILLAFDIVTREVSIEINPAEILDTSAQEGSLAHYYRSMISTHIENGIEMHRLLLKRINKLILSQTSFKFGIIYFALFIVLSVLFGKYNTPKNPSMEIIDKIIIKLNDISENDDKKFVRIDNKINLTNKILQSIDKKIKGKPEKKRPKSK